MDKLMEKLHDPHIDVAQVLYGISVLLTFTLVGQIVNHL